MAKKDKGQYRVQASTEAEVARARLVRAEQAAERGDKLKAIDLAVESAFDAGISKTFALLAGEREFQNVADKIVDDAQDFVRSVAASSPQPFARAANPKSSKQAMKLAQSSSLMGAVFYAGGAHGYARADKDDVMMAKSIRFFDETYAQAREGLVGSYQMATVSNPGLPPSKLKNKLLR
jgi:hypothetical protein